MNEEQLKIIEEEIDRLFKRKWDIDVSGISDFETYINGRIDSLKWVKENL